jgi:hypothetical protein
MSLDDLGPAGICVFAALTFWFIISIPHQFNNEFGQRIKKLNTFALIPGWTFFAPTPGTTNYRFVFRDYKEDGSCGEWQEVEWCGCRRLMHAVWHPERHRTKLIVDCVSAFILTAQEMRKLGLKADGGTQPWVVSVPYLALLNVAVSMPRTLTSKARQFAIVEQTPSAPSEKPRVIVCSSAHDI